jgi:hypothetical protein
MCETEDVSDQAFSLLLLGEIMWSIELLWDLGSPLGEFLAQNSLYWVV